MIMEIESFMYRGLQIETPFERELRQRALDRKTAEENREQDVAFQAKLLQLKYDSLYPKNKRNGFKFNKERAI